MYVFPLILYRLAVLPLPKARRLALQRSLSKLLWGDARLMVRRQVCIQHTRNGDLGMPDLESHWLAERLAYLGRSLTGDAMWTQRLKIDVSLWAKHCLSANAERPFITFLCPVTFHGLEKNYIGSYWWVPLRTLLGSGAAGRRRRSALTGIGRQDRAS